VRDAHHWAPGTEFTVIERPDGILLKPAEPPRRKLTFEEFRALVPPHEGPPVTLEDMEAAIHAEAVARFERKTRR
jgi:bifunctional DNA-binding transcriptional regulator/antitoxin component of YhaV-PrlF toxin-antitoxin module